MTTAVLGGPTALGLRSRLRRLLAGAHRPLLRRALPSSVLFALTAMLLAGGALPVANDSLVLAGLGLAALAAVVSRVIPEPVAPGGLVPVAQLGAVALLYAGTASAAVLFLVLGPVLALVAGPGRRGVLTASFGTAAVLSAPVLLAPTAVLPPGSARRRPPSRGWRPTAPPWPRRSGPGRTSSTSRPACSPRAPRP